MKLLIVEDNLELAADMQQFLSDSGFVVEQVSNLDAAFVKIHLYQYDVIIVDIGLPDGSGLELIRQMKNDDNHAGILIVTANETIEDKVKGLELGADDYMTKPFHKAELNARIRSIIRRSQYRGKNTIRFNEIVIEVDASVVHIGEMPISLTRKEYDLLLYFLVNRNRVLTKESIAEHLWGDHIDQADSFDFIYNHIKNLRKKIIKAGGRDYIKSMYGMGYKFIE